MSSQIEINKLWKRIDERIEEINGVSNKNWQKLEPFLLDYATDLETLFNLGDKRAEVEAGTVDNICHYIACQAVHNDWCKARRVYQIIPSRFKDLNKSHLKYPAMIDYPELADLLGAKIAPKISSPAIGEITFYDCPDYTLLTELGDVIERAKTIIENDPDWFTHEKMTLAEWDEVHDLYTMIYDEKQAMDDRYDIRSIDTRRYIEAVAITSIRRTADIYHAFLKLTVRLTTKALGKFIKGKSKHSPIEPQSQDEAIRKGFCGKQCPECKSWRYEEKINSLGSANVREEDLDLKEIIPPTSFYRCFSCGYIPEIELPEIKG